MQIAVIGAGLAGVAAAQELSRSGHEVVVWEKSRGVGGRTASRRGAGGVRFDHGAPFLHDGKVPLTGEPALAEHDLQLAAGATQRQTVGFGAGNAPAKAIAAESDVRTAVRVGQIMAAGSGWALADGGGAALGTYDAVVVTAPAPQAAELLAPWAPELAEQAASVAFDPCWAVMASWSEPLGLSFTAAGDSDDLRWAVADAPKPGRPPGERWVLHAAPAWTQAHLELDAAEAAALLLQQFTASLPVAPPEPEHLDAHRWRYAQPRTPLDDPYLRHGTLLVAGDWCGGSTAGAALRSGRAAAAALAG